MYEVVIAQDDDGRYYVEKSDIIGLHAEADSLDELKAIIVDLAPDLIEANHQQPRILGVLFGRQPPRIKVSQALCLA